MEYHSGGSLPLLGRPRYCPGANANGGYLCETGHCCGETGCCTYYYELWWFWLLWTVLILFSCCCAYRHRRAKLRVQQQQRQREISLLAYHGASSFPSSMLDLSFLASLKLPSYEEVAAQPSTPPPPYSSVFTTPRYPQPPRATDPHLLTQHGPLLHRPLSDGPSSLSSDNSSSCSCDSCCPSSPCSSSLSAPITYETDTSHASTPSEATPLTLDITMETVAAAACCLEANKARFTSERHIAALAIDIEDAENARAQEPNAKDASLPSQTVIKALVTGATSPPHLLSPGSVAVTSPIIPGLDLASRSPIISAGGSSALSSPGGDAVQLQSIKILRTESMSGPPTPSADCSRSCKTVRTLETLGLTRTLDPASISCSPASAPLPDCHKTLAFKTSSASLQTPDRNHSFVPVGKPVTPTHTPGPENLTPDPEHDLTPAPDPILTNLTPVSNTQTTKDPDSITDPASTLKPTDLNPTQNTEAGSSLNLESVPGSGLVQGLHSPGSGLVQGLHSPGSGQAQSPHIPGSGLAQSPHIPGSGLVQGLHSPESGLVQTPHSPGSGLVQGPGSGLVELSDSTVSHPVLTSSVGDSGPALVSHEPSEPPLPSEVQYGSSSGSPSSPQSLCPPGVSCPFLEVSSSSCPSITVQSETSLTMSHSPLTVLPLSSPRSPPPLSAPVLLLDPLSALQQSDKGGSSSGHGSSLSPSPRATQSPPKQTVFSPCVDVFEPGPPCWEDGDEEQEDGDNEEDEDDDVGADESQYRHRRLTGDSGIEVCRCRVEEEDEEKEESRRGGGGNTDVHDSADCPARGQLGTGDELSLCTPAGATPAPEDGSQVVIVMETV